MDCHIWGGDEKKEKEEKEEKEKEEEEKERVEEKQEEEEEEEEEGKEEKEEKDEEGEETEKEGKEETAHLKYWGCTGQLDQQWLLTQQVQWWAPIPMHTISVRFQMLGCCHQMPQKQPPSLYQLHL